MPPTLYLLRLQIIESQKSELNWVNERGAKVQPLITFFENQGSACPPPHMKRVIYARW